MSGGTKRSDANYGIQANTVQAGALAVGPNARATSHSGPNEHDLRDAVASLRAAITTLQLHPNGHKAIEGDLDALEKEATALKPDTERAGSLLQSIVGKLQMVGSAIHDAAGLAGALSNLGELLKIPLGS